MWKFFPTFKNAYWRLQSTTKTIRGCCSFTLPSTGGGDFTLIVGFSTTHGHITDCKLDLVVYACVWGYCCGELIWTGVTGM